MIGLSIDSSRFKASLPKLKHDTNSSITYSAFEVGQEILRLSQMEVPHDKGTLQNSGDVERIGDIVIVGYHTPYAARLHEHPEYRFQKGRKGKYLTDPIRRNQNALGIKVAKDFGRRMHLG